MQDKYVKELEKKGYDVGFEGNILTIYTDELVVSYSVLDDVKEILKDYGKSYGFKPKSRKSLVKAIE